MPRIGWYVIGIGALALVAWAIWSRRAIATLPASSTAPATLPNQDTTATGAAIAPRLSAAALRAAQRAGMLTTLFGPVPPPPPTVYVNTPDRAGRNSPDNLGVILTDGAGNPLTVP